MTDSRETWVLCDVEGRSGVPADALRISLGDKNASMSVNIAGIENALAGQLTPRFVDLIRIAAFVLGADGAVQRGQVDDDDTGEKWHRHFHFIIGVDDPKFWSQPQLRTTIESTLGYLSQDSFAFEFCDRSLRTQRQLVFTSPTGGPIVPWDHIDEVALFSGGLDSFAGAADLILKRKLRTILVSHNSSPKTRAVQTDLFGELHQLAQANGCPTPVHASVMVHRHDERLRPERTQRTRSFLFAAIAGAVANLVQRDRVCMHENGIVAINLPIASPIVGARATRTAHPRALSRFGDVLSLVAGRRVQVDNPFVFKSRADILRDLADSPALPLAKRTVSCGQVHQQSRMHPHCGVCSQCLDRQFGFRGAGMERHDSEEGYAVPFIDGEWTDDRDRSLLLSWVSRADQYAACKTPDGFIEAFGDAARTVPFLMQAAGVDADTAAAQIYELHHRHGQTVSRVLAEIAAGSAADMRAGRLKPNTLPMLMARQALAGSTASMPPSPAFGIENQIRRTGGTWSIRFRNGTAFDMLDSPGLRYLCVLLGSPGEVRTAAALIAIADGREPPEGAPLNARGKAIVRAHITAITVDRDAAQDVCDQEAARRCQAEIDSLTKILNYPTGGGRRTSKADARTGDQIQRVLAEIAKKCPRLGNYLAEKLQVGDVFWYRRDAMRWDVEPVSSTSALPDDEWVGAATLVDAELSFIKEPRDVTRFCEQHEIPNRRAKTKDGRDHPRRREVHRPSFLNALRRAKTEQRLLQDAADRTVTERERREQD